MVAAKGLLRIFWPSDTPKSKTQGTIVGWRNSELDIFVVSVLEDVEVAMLITSIFAFTDLHEIVIPSGVSTSNWHVVSQ